MNNIKMTGINNLDRLVMSEIELRRAILGDFASLYMSEVQKLIERHGKNDFLDMLKNER